MNGPRVYLALITVLSIMVWTLFRQDDSMQAAATNNGEGVNDEFAIEVSPGLNISTDKALSIGDNQGQTNEGEKDSERSEVIIPATLLRTPKTYFDPSEIVDRHLVRAESGDPTSTFIIAEVGLFCRGAPSSQASLDSIMSNPSMDKYLLRKAKESFDRCAELRISGSSAIDARKFPLTSGKHDQFPLYQLRYDSIEREERQGLLVHAISTGLDEPFLTGYMIEAYASLFSRYEGYEDEFTFIAAHLSACKFQKLCDPIEVAAEAQKYYPPSKYQELIALAEKIQEGVQQRNPEKLGL